MSFFYRRKRKSLVRRETSPLEEAQKEKNHLIFKNLSVGLEKTRVFLSHSIDSLFHGKTSIDEDLLESLHETLYRSDMGVTTTDKLISHLRKTVANEKNCDSSFIKDCLSKKILELLEVKVPSNSSLLASPHIVLIVGVNGAGKTTSIGKLAAKFLEQGKSVSICAADTYRAAAIDQLKIWGERLKVKVFSQKEGADPAAVAFDSVRAVKARATDVLIIDTAGRLQSKRDLMEELAKIKRVIKKEYPEAPHETLMVVDATMGQNVIQQVSAFSEFVEITGLVVTKLDGTAKGGVVVALTDKFNIPVRYIGIGEAVSDLKSFNPKDYVGNILN